MLFPPVVSQRPVAPNVRWVWKEACTCNGSTGVSRVITVATEWLSFPRPVSLSLLTVNKNCGDPQVTHIESREFTKSAGKPIGRPLNPAWPVFDVTAAKSWLPAESLSVPPREVTCLPSSHALNPMGIPKGQACKGSAQQGASWDTPKGELGTLKKKKTLVSPEPNFPFLTNHLRFLFIALLTLNGTAHDQC